jgi:hypothetical protein
MRASHVSCERCFETSGNHSICAPLNRLDRERELGALDVTGWATREVRACPCACLMSSRLVIGLPTRKAAPAFALGCVPGGGVTKGASTSPPNPLQVRVADEWDGGCRSAARGRHLAAAEWWRWTRKADRRRVLTDAISVRTDPKGSGEVSTLGDGTSKAGPRACDPRCAEITRRLIREAAFFLQLLRFRPGALTEPASSGDTQE